MSGLTANVSHTLDSKAVFPLIKMMGGVVG